MQKKTTILAAILVLFSVLFVSAAQAKTYADQQCGFQFAYPAGWKLKKDRFPCSVLLQPVDLAERMKDETVGEILHPSKSDYFISVRIKEEKLEEAATSVGFELRDNEWVVLGRMDAVDGAERISSAYWTGVKGDPTIGCYQEGGGYMGLCNPTWALLSNNKNYSAVLIREAYSDEKVYNVVLESFRFIDRENQ